MKKSLIIIGIVAALVVLYAWSSYNGLVTLREDATAEWQQVEVNYQRRFDLIPNLAEAVRRVMTQEQEIFTALADARSRYSGAQTVSDKAAAASQVETAFGRLLAVMENYPTLKSADNVRDLMAQLEGTENRVSVARTRYNEKVRTYQTAIKRFPKNIVASTFGFDPMDYFEAQEGTENAPRI